MKYLFRIINLILMVITMWIGTLFGLDAASGGVAYLTVFTADLGFKIWEQRDVGT